jgi:hypothetical protein
MILAEKDLPRLTDNGLEKTIIEAGALLITLLLVCEQIRDLPAIPAPGDLFSIAFVLAVAVLFATLAMLCRTRADNRLAGSIVATGRITAAVAFGIGLAMVARIFYGLILSLGTSFDLWSIIVSLIGLTIVVFVASWQMKGRAQ